MTNLVKNILDNNDYKRLTVRELYEIDPNFQEVLNADIDAVVYIYPDGTITDYHGASLTDVIDRDDVEYWIYGAFKERVIEEIVNLADAVRNSEMESDYMDDYIDEKGLIYCEFSYEDWLRFFKYYMTQELNKIELDILYDNCDFIINQLMSH